MKDEMTPRERWLAALNMEPVDRLPFWPKLNASYAIAQQEPFRSLSVVELHDWMGSDKHIGIGRCFKEVRSNTSIEMTRDNGTRRTVFKTPHGELESVDCFDAPSHSWHPVKFPIASREDILLMTEFLEDTEIELNHKALEQSRARVQEIGESSVTASTIGKSPLMHWVEWYAGVENAHYLLSDYPDEVQALFDAHHKDLLKKTEIEAEYCPADLFYFSENTSTTLISPVQYKKYCLGHLRDYRDVLDSHGKCLVLHMCGLLKDLLPDINEVQAPVFEAFTSPPLGDTTFLDGRTACPKVCLIGGTNAVIWTQPDQVIIAELESHLQQLPHHRGLVVTSAGVMPPLAKPETIRNVCRWVKEFPVKQ